MPWQPASAAIASTTTKKNSTILTLTLSNGDLALIRAKRVREVTKHDDGRTRVHLDDTNIPVMAPPEVVNALRKATRSNG